MRTLRDEVPTTASPTANPSFGIWLYLTAEFLIGAAISSVFVFLDIVRSLLPKPPRELTGDVVLIAGASSSLGSCLVEEFAAAECSVICVDQDQRDLQRSQEIVSRIQRDREIQEISPTHRGSASKAKSLHCYQCNLQDRNEIRSLSKRIRDDIGDVDVLVTCHGNTQQDIYDATCNTLMIHYWTVLAFLPSMLKRGKGHIVGVTPVISIEDAYAGSRAAIAGLMESLGRDLSQHGSELTFISVAPKADPRLLNETERQIAKDIVEAVRQDQTSLSMSRASKMLYRASCQIHRAITVITQWLRSEGCDYPI